LEIIAVNTTIAKTINATNQNNRIVLFENILPSNIPSSGIISINGFLKNLKAFSNINSLAEATLPDIKLEDSDQERLIKILNIEWNAARIQLDLEISSDGINFIKIGSVSLINQMGYPYKNYSLLDFYTDGLAAELGANGKIACTIKDVGFGKLSANDELTIYGSVAQEIVLNDISSVSMASLVTTAVSSNVATKIVNSNSNRRGLLIFNDSASKVYLGFSNAIDTTNYSIPLMANKGYEFPQPIFTGNIYAYSATAINLQVTEFG
jgi:hypothetical protein